MKIENQKTLVLFSNSNVIQCAWYMILSMFVFNIDERFVSIQSKIDTLSTCQFYHEFDYFDLVLMMLSFDFDKIVIVETIAITSTNIVNVPNSGTAKVPITSIS